VANDPVQKRLARAAKRLERQRRRTRPARNPLQPRPGHGIQEPPPPDWFGDPEGGAGVREPRRPLPTQPAGALELDATEFQNLDETATPLR
jgi:hypothetical protein